MPPKSKKNRDDFEVPNKHRIKVEKRDRKQELRSKSALGKQLVESSQNSDEDQYHEKMINKGSEWWQKVHKRFFRELSPEEIQQFCDKTSGQQLLELKYPAKQLQTYLAQEILSQSSHLGNPNLLQVLFRKEIKLEREEINELVTFGWKQYPQEAKNIEGKPSSNLHLFNLHLPPEAEQTVPEECFLLDLEITNLQQREEEIVKYLSYDVITSENNEIQRQILLYENQLKNVAIGNRRAWREMLDRRAEHPPHLYFQNQIAQIRLNLRMAEVLLYFKRGHSDKTEEMLEQALEVARIREMTGEGDQRSGLTRVQQLKSLFETDCKICFCTESQDKNRVVYCDGCNTSFHQACYGVEELGDQKFYCEVCEYIQSNTIRDRQGVARFPKKPNCHLCNKQNFPMRCLQNRFYHVTCLVLFDLVQLRNFQIHFKVGISHSAILQSIVKNQINTNHCCICLKETGMKFKCSWEGCSNCYHPICAYLNGVVFDLKRSYTSLETQLMCPEHYPQRNSMEQVYLRRFFCDYNNTAKLTENEFEGRFKLQLERRRVNRENKMTERRQGVLKKGKFPKTSKPPSSSKPKSIPDRPQPQSQPQPQPSQVCLTETRMLLKMRSENKPSN